MENGEEWKWNGKWNGNEMKLEMEMNKASLKATLKSQGFRSLQLLATASFKEPKS